MPELEINKYAPTAWDTRAENLVDLTCPSGQLCQVRKPGTEGLMKLGLLERLDNLTGTVHTDHIARVKGEVTPEVPDITNDPVARKEMLDIMNQIVAVTVVQPKLSEDVEKASDRVEGLVYMSDVDLEDKTFIMQYALGGSADLATFREKRDKIAGTLAAGEKVPPKAKRIVKPKSPR